MIYLDNNATTPVDPEVSDAVFSSLKRDFGNPSSIHLTGRKSRDSIETSRSVIAEFLECSPEEIFFTSGGTESNNLAIIGTVLSRNKGHIITSSIEHPSVLNPCRYLEALGFEVSYVPANERGIVESGRIRESLRRDTVLISLMHSNNETGVLQPVVEVGALAEEHAIPFHIDAAQTLGKMPFSLGECRAKLLTVVSHKFYGPKGVGALYVRRGTTLKPILFGAGHESGLRPGTENIAGIAGLAKASELAGRDMKLRVAHTTNLRDLLLRSLKKALPELQLNGDPEKRLPNTLNVSIPGISGTRLVEILKDRVAFSTGSACHSGQTVPSVVLKCMGLSDEEAFSSIRLSVGKDNTEEEIGDAAAIITAAVKDLRSTGPQF